ncbi:MAG: zinc ribbon domain-containing protein [Promethearchaeota archaeon]
MNISKFNKELGTKIARAKSFEKFGEIKSAIDSWLDISEMVLKKSKESTIDNHYRNMLLKKAREIMDHIKYLKAKYQQPIESISKVDKSQPITMDKEEASSIEELNNETEYDSEIDSKSKGPELQKIKRKKDIEFKNLPEGVIPIEPPKEIKVITPYDKDYIKQRLEQAKKMDMSIFSSKKTSENEIGEDKIVVCPMCGKENPPGTLRCENCGIELK